MKPKIKKDSDEPLKQTVLGVLLNVKEKGDITLMVSHSTCIFTLCNMLYKIITISTVLYVLNILCLICQFVNCDLIQKQLSSAII